MSLDAVRGALIGQWRAAYDTLFSSPDHIGFKVLGIVPALAVAAGLPIWIAAAFFGLVSIGCLYVIWRIAQLVSGADRVANWAALLASVSVALFYFSRHVFPYDPALCFGLIALLTGLRDGRGRSTFVAGVWAGAGFLTYNGYWLFCGAALTAGVVASATGVRSLARRAALGGVGLLVPVAVAALFGLGAGRDFLHGATAFAHTVNQGDYTEGWRFPWAYLDSGEGPLLIVWLAGWGRGPVYDAIADGGYCGPVHSCLSVSVSG